MEGISILITAYNTKKYIKECLDSVNNQSWFKVNKNYEILLGIDNCQDTLNYVIKIANRYRNLRIFMMDKNVGTYITTNTLISISKYDYIMRFDSDDIMHKDMVLDSIKNLTKYDIVRYSHKKFINNNIKLKKGKTLKSCGQICFKRYVLDKLGGYYPVVCAADRDFIGRAKISGFNIKIIKRELFYRRKHRNSLTGSTDTGKRGHIRIKLKIFFKQQLNKNIIFVHPKTCKFKEIEYENKYSNKMLV